MSAAQRYKKVASLPNGVHPQNEGLSAKKEGTKYKVADLYKFVKTYDKYFTPAHSVSPEALNPDGTPKVFFHGTRSEFDEFLKSAAGRSSMPALAGFWFTDSKAGALAFAENT